MNYCILFCWFLIGPIWERFDAVAAVEDQVAGVCILKVELDIPQYYVEIVE